MQINVRKFTAGIVMLAIIVFTFSYGVYAQGDITVLINGETLECSEPPIIQEGRTFIPMRDVFEGLGARLVWNTQERRADAVYKDVLVTVLPDEGTLIKNGEIVELDAKPFIQNDRILIPLRAVAQCFGYNVIWSGRERIVSVSTDAVLKAYFLDCGQADSIFIALPDGKCMLIDAGESYFGEKLDSFIREKGYSHIDYVVASHPHSDHIGAMAHILENFTVGTFYMPDVVHTTKTYEKMLDALENNGCSRVLISSGDTIADGIYDVRVLSPEKAEYVRMNDYSAVIKLTHKNFSVLFSADAEARAEGKMVDAGADLGADILKAGHHGSATSTTERYLDAVSPRDVIISVGEGNSYGFPSALVMAQLNERNINVYRTDINGNITVVTDGYVYVIEGDK